MFKRILWVCDEAIQLNKELNYIKMFHNTLGVIEKRVFFIVIFHMNW